MTKQQVIDILEAYKPSGNIYSGYNSIEEKIDERICYLIDEIIEKIKREPNDWIKCSEKMPQPMRQVLFYDSFHKDYAVGFYNDNYGFLQVGTWVITIGDNEYYTRWRILPQPPKEEK